VFITWNEKDALILRASFCFPYGFGVGVKVGTGVGIASLPASSAVLGISIKIQRRKASSTSGLRCPLDNLQQIAVRVARNNIVVLVVTSAQNIFVAIHNVVVVFLIRAVAGDAVALDNRRDVDIIGWDLGISQRREERLDLRLFKAVIPRIAHESNDVINLAASKALRVVSFPKRIHACIGTAIGDDLGYRSIVEGVEDVLAVDGRDFLAFEALHTLDFCHRAVIAMTFDTIDRIQILPGDNLVHQRGRDLDGLGFGRLMDQERGDGEANH
jgi:hypothetical protein